MKLRLEVYNDKDERAGYAMLELHSGELHVSWINVHPAERGSGFGTKLMNLIVEYARRRGVARVTGFIDTHDGDVEARIRFFKRLGELSYANGALSFTIYA